MDWLLSWWPATHAAFQLPGGVLGLTFYSREIQLPELFSAFVIALLLASSLGSLADFAIYAFIYRAFRRRVADLFSCSLLRCTALEQTVQSVNEHEPYRVNPGTAFAAAPAESKSHAQRVQCNSSIELKGSQHIKLVSVHKVSPPPPQWAFFIAMITYFIRIQYSTYTVQ